MGNYSGKSFNNRLSGQKVQVFHLSQYLPSLYRRNRCIRIHAYERIKIGAFQQKYRLVLFEIIGTCMFGFPIWIRFPKAHRLSHAHSWEIVQISPRRVDEFLDLSQDLSIKEVLDRSTYYSRSVQFHVARPQKEAIKSNVFFVWIILVVNQLDDRWND
jgi:hypothetical protein